jgi:hypothetical protein
VCSGNSATPYTTRFNAFGFRCEGGCTKNNGRDASAKIVKISDRYTLAHKSNYKRATTWASERPLKNGDPYHFTLVVPVGDTAFLPVQS